MTSYCIREEMKDDMYYLEFLGAHEVHTRAYLTIDIAVSKEIVDDYGILAYRNMITDIIQDDIRRERSRSDKG